MAKDQKIGAMLKLLFGTVTCLSFALPALSDSPKLTKTSCPREFSKQSTLPTSLNCNMVRLPDGTMLQTVPKLFSTPAVFAGKIPGQHIVCRIPDCGKNLCKNGWCEETMVGYNCTCSSGFQGRHCDEKLTELSTTDAKTKAMTSPTTTMSNTTTLQDTTNPTCSSPPMECEFGGSFYNFSTCRMNHSSAVSACSEYGSHLVFIETQEEQDFIVGRVSKDYWIGLTGLSLSEARWLDGSSLTYRKFTPWSFDENVKCFRIAIELAYICRPSWQDKDCSKQLKYICEK